MGVDSRLFEIEDASNVSLRAKFLLGQKMVRMAYADVFSTIRDIYSQVGREPDEDMFDYLQRRAEQAKEADDVALNRYKLENRLAPVEELQAIEATFAVPADPQEM